MNKRVAMIPSTVGFHWEEVFDAYSEFRNAGWQVDIFTVNGQPAVADPKSLERRPFLSLAGLGLNERISPETPTGRELSHRLQEDIQPIELLYTEVYDAFYIPGGHGCLFDVNINTAVHSKVLEAYEQGKILSAVCHGTSTFAFVLSQGAPIVKGKRMTGFPDLLDRILLKAGWIYKKFLPLPFSNEQKMKSAGAIITGMDILLSTIIPTYKKQDLPFITGVGPKAARGVARAVIRTTEKTGMSKEEEAVIEG